MYVRYEEYKYINGFKAQNTIREFHRTSSKIISGKNFKVTMEKLKLTEQKHIHKKSHEATIVPIKLAKLFFKNGRLSTLIS